MNCVNAKIISSKIFLKKCKKIHMKIRKILLLKKIYIILFCYTCDKLKSAK